MTFGKRRNQISEEIEEEASTEGRRSKTEDQSW